MEDVDPVLKQLDLTDAEITLYKTLLREGEGTASRIAKCAGVHRRLAYDKFESLMEKGLVSYTDKENKRIYNPTNPKRLQELVEERRDDLDALERQMQDVIPELMTHFNAETSDREVRVLEGKDAIKQLFNDELREADDTIYVIGSPKESEEILKYFLPSWTEKRRDKDITIKGVFEHEMRGMVGEHGPIEDRYLPDGHESTVSMSVYGDKVGIIFWIDNPLVIMIEDPDAAESFMGYFQLMWAAAEE